jgi:hypothetical protein
MTPEDAKKMEGTEFIYQYHDGDTVRAFIKKFDPEVGLTCMTLETESEYGWRPGHGTHVEDDGTWCVVGYKFKLHKIKDALAVLDIILTDGIYKVGSSGSKNIGSTINCAFGGR